MKKTAIAITVAAMMTAAPTAQAQKTKDTVGCLTKAWLEEFIRYVQTKDHKGAKYLLSEKRCTGIKDGLPISIVEEWGSRVKIRVYVGDDALELWTVKGMYE